jgi:hypothetical protein
LKVGDRVMLIPHCNMSCVASKAASLNCLGKSKEGRVGVIVKVTSNLYTGAKVQGSRQFGIGEDNNIVTVMGINRDVGKLCDYAVSDLRYADRSAPGVIPVHIKAGPDIAGNPKQKTKPAIAISGVFTAGDRVKLRKTASDLRGCLGEPSYGWVGTVAGPTSGAKIRVQCQSASGGSYPQLSGKYPNHDYLPSELISEFGTEDEVAALPLIPGDRVVLADDYFTFNKDGFCLGKAGATVPKVGVVLYAPPATSGGGSGGGGSSGAEQREVIVAAIDNQHCPYSFRGSHLQRVDNDGSVRFEVGDRVQLDVARYSSQDDVCDGKCLGTVANASYGLVCDPGIVRDGILRNIEVVAVGGPRDGMISMYPGYALTTAVRSTILTNDDRRLLVDIVKGLAVEAGITAIDAETLVQEFGLGVWARLQSITKAIPSPASSTVVFDAWKTFEEERSTHWSAEPPLELLSDRLSAACKADSSGASDTPLISLRNRLRTDIPQFWTCKSCKMDKNPNSKTACLACSVKAPRWVCEGCSTSNKIGDWSCISCFLYVEESSQLTSEKDESWRISEGKRVEREAEMTRKKQEKEAEAKVRHQEALQRRKAALEEAKTAEFFAGGAEPLPEVI